MALVAWFAPWDDYWQNQFLYKFKTSAGQDRWMIYPWDFDLFWNTCRAGRSCGGFGGGIKGPSSSMFIGEKDNCDNRAAKTCDAGRIMAGECTQQQNGQVIGWWWSPFKDAYFKAYRDEHKAMLTAMIEPGGPLETAYVHKLVDDFRKEYDFADARKGGSLPFLEYCDNHVYPNYAILQDSTMKQFTTARNNRVIGGLWDGPQGYACPSNSGQ
jgi:hypothetical protein